MKKSLGWLVGLLVVGLVVYGGIQWFFPSVFGDKRTLSEYVQATDDTNTTFLVKEAAGTVQVTSRMPDEETFDWVSNEDLVNAYTGDWLVTFDVQNNGQTARIYLKDSESLSQSVAITSDVAYAAYVPYATPQGNEVGLFVATDDQKVIDAIKKDPQSAEAYKDKAEIRYVGIETK